MTESFLALYPPSMDAGGSMVRIAQTTLEAGMLASLFETRGDHPIA